MFSFLSLDAAQIFAVIEFAYEILCRKLESSSHEKIVCKCGTNLGGVTLVAIKFPEEFPLRIRGI